MKCPWCDNEMVKGWMQSSRRVLFTTIKSEWGLNIKDKTDIVLTANNFSNPTAIAYHCDKCKKVIVDYTEKPE